METTSTTSDSASRGDGSEWPVLARLPDVTDLLPSMTPRSSRAAAADFVSYRFDPPERAEDGGQSVVKASRRVSQSIDSRPGRPHILPNTSRSRARGESPILPRSNPFAIPRTSLHDVLAPAARFLLLFALATVIGTSILTLRRHAEPVDEVVEPATTAAQRSLEPQTPPTASHGIEQPVAPPTAAGPLGTKTPRTGLRTNQREQTAVQNPQSAAVATKRAVPRVAVSNWRLVPQVQTSDDPAVPEFPDPALVATESLPAAPQEEPESDEESEAGEAARPAYQPQTQVDQPQPGDEEDSAAAPATARLPGYILAAPTQQAHHDDHQSSLH